ncbi:hypothetical protein WICMUC_000592 [Wickerhamomyces mucosus]|uniref:C2H2-type domain-containing protein n=1 Tax=Wickerhamomyces mucosus TaxID=1378264 RepID=A0A9P8TIA6_9ASCO|nr:hypothetical protein WICMUC_000592 [Wickerhamomyces mucosus]
MGRYSVKRYKTKRRTRDLDLIYNDLGSKESILKLKNQELDETKPGMGQFYCIHCAKYFENEQAIQTHYKSKIHKRRVKELKARPYTNLESEAATGSNLEKFLESVERHKQRIAEEELHKEEIHNLVTINNPKIIALEQPTPETPIEPLDENEVVMK